MHTQIETLVSEFSSWAGVRADASLQLDWDDVEGNTRRRLEGLAHEKMRQQEARRLRAAQKEAPDGYASNVVARRARTAKH
eukprot:366092-Chlamydomonas_euryale.AAC.2